jgi:hypothetical protein
LTIETGYVVPANANWALDQFWQSWKSRKILDGIKRKGPNSATKVHPTIWKYRQEIPKRAFQFELLNKSLSEFLCAFGELKAELFCSVVFQSVRHLEAVVDSDLHRDLLWVQIRRGRFVVCQNCGLMSYSSVLLARTSLHICRYVPGGLPVSSHFICSVCSG